MADTKLGGSLDSYMIAKSGATSYTPNDENIWYRGYKHFLIYRTNVGSNPKVIVKRHGGAGQIKVTLYSMSNLLSDPGTQKYQDSFTGDDTTNPHTFNIDMSNGTTYPDGLYRLYVEPEFNSHSFTVIVQDMQYYAVEATEPRYNLYFHGTDRQGNTPIEQYFWVPNLPSGEKVKVKLQTEKNVEKAQLKIFKVGDSTAVVNIAIDGDVNSSNGAYFASAEFDPSTANSGQMYKLQLIDPANSGQQAEGNIWVRFSRNVPHYFANDPDRLIIPIVHRDFDPVLYAGKTQTYSAYLCADRSTSGIGSNTLKAKVGSTSDTETSGYRASVNYTAPSTRTKLDDIDSDNVAQLLNGSTPIAKATDKIDTIYIVKQPSDWGSWQNPLYLVYDDDNGDPADVIDDAHFHVGQCNNSSNLDEMHNNGIKAMGVLYSGTGLLHMSTHFESYPNDSRVMFWALADEPDSGPGGIGKPMRLRKDLCEDYYDRKGSTDKPISLNLMHAWALSEFAEACDVISTDPYIKAEPDYIGTDKITEWKSEVESIVSGVDSIKKTIIVLWIWHPNISYSLVDPFDFFDDEHDLLFDDVEIDCIACFKFRGIGGSLPDHPANSGEYDLWFNHVTPKNDRQRPS